ncbi:MAG: hypothetical protein CMJ19_03050 [Phycisphaeraceae bacterium]|nr:hypothetical protein [Phycisphaeraceae bacterium]
MEPVKPQKEHLWLKQILGKWKVTFECAMGPDQPTAAFEGVETVQSIGEIWFIARGENQTPCSDGDQAGNSMMTLGYDTAKGYYVGSFVCSMMNWMWQYHDGQLDDAGKILTLKTTGPLCTGEGLAEYEDAMEIIDTDHRVLRSRMKMPDGSWQQIMQGKYQRI